MGEPMNTPIGDGWFEWNEEFERGDLTDRSYPPLGPYDNREVVSALRKSIKMARKEEAIWWLTVALECGSGSGGHLRYLARQLWIVAAEDLYDQGVVLQAFAVYQMLGVCNETDHLYVLVSMMCDAEKIHQDTGAEMDRFWGEAIGRMVNGRWRQVPSYAVDRHTLRGQMMMRQKNWPDERFSGTEFGRAATRFIWGAYGELTPLAELTGRFWQYWRERKEAYGIGKKLRIRKTAAEKKEQPSLLEEGK